MLNKTIFITRYIWENFTKYLPIVMVSHQWVTRHWQTINYVTKIMVCFDITTICEITCNYTEFSIRMMFYYVLNTRIKSLTRI